MAEGRVDGKTESELTGGMVIRSLFWVGAALGAILGGIEAVAGLSAAQSAPQQAAAAAMAMCYAVIPYCLARAVSKIGRD